MQLQSTLSNGVERYLDLAASAVKLTAQNMANVDTPGYRAMGIDFETEMRSALSDAGQGMLGGRSEVRPEEGLIARPDGNNVSVDRESLNLAEAQLKFKTGVSLLRQQYQMEMDAIHADK